ncbi:MAG TPA: hypothetical protein VK918_06985 [Pyrinomonadaceae bacterium]|nr:hypothetical protein [Pyrinomonadaceae bacterium]
MDLDSVFTFLRENLVIPITAVVFITVFGALFLGWLLKLRRTIHVAKHGVAGTAVVKGVRQTGAMKNDIPKIAMKLEVTLPGIPTYTIEKRAYIPMIYYPRIQPGMTIDVVADPARTDNAKSRRAVQG